jgi:hypothetical protein
MATSRTEPVDPAQRDRPSALADRRRIPINAFMVVLTMLVTLTFLMFTLVEPTPRWLLIFGAIVAGLGVDGTLRVTWREAFSGDTPTDPAPFVFLPALFVLATPVLIEHNVRGYWVIPAALAGGAAFGGILLAEIISVRERAPEYAIARVVATGGSYFVAFALFSLMYVFDLDVRTAVGGVGLVTMMLAIELLHEGQVDPFETLMFAAISALVVSETRWTLHYFPIDGYLAGLTLVLVFFFVTGLLNAHLTRRLDVVLAAEYIVIGAIGLGLVVFARMSGAA